MKRSTLAESSSSKAVSKKRKRSEIEESASESGSSSESSSGQRGDIQSDSGSDEEEENAEGPRMSQWVDEDELEEEVVEERDEKTNLRKGLESLSFGALLRAKRTLAKQESSSSSSEGSSSDSESSQEDDRINDGRDDEERRERKEKVKRANKHAPMEISSKRPVSRKRTILEGSTVKFRDPRFGDAVGEYSTDHFRKDYSFLSDVREKELGTLRESLKRAKKLLASSPHHLRSERAAEVDRLERTVKRTESAIERTRREGLERDALQRLKHEEKSKRSQGKGAWYLKKSDEKKFKIQARFESLSGKEAKKVMEKKMKKVAQREKKSRPFAPGSNGIGARDRRGPTMSEDGIARKKKRVSES